MRHNLTSESSLQEIFDIVYPTMIAQGDFATTEKGNCAYLTSDGRRCAIGHLIPNEDDAREAAGPVVDLRHKHPNILGFVPTRDQMSFMTQLQIAHDSSAHTSSRQDTPDWERFVRQMKNLAEEHGLEIPCTK